MEILTLLVGIVKAWPALDKWAERFYEAKKVYDRNKSIKENTDAIRKAYAEKDQRDLEEVIGNPHPGEPSLDDGAHVRPPRAHGVSDSPASDGGSVAPR